MRSAGIARLGAVTRLPRPVSRLAVLAALVALPLTGCSLLGSMMGGNDIPEGESDVFSIAVGDCLNDLEVADVVESVPIVDCAEPHDSEAFARTDSTAATFPGDAALSDELSAYCQGEVFTDFVGVPYAESVYGTSGYFPTEGSWDGGDRELLCTIFDPDGQVTGSLAGAAE